MKGSVSNSSINQTLSSADTSGIHCPTGRNAQSEDERNGLWHLSALTPILRRRAATDAAAEHSLVAKVVAATEEQQRAGGSHNANKGSGDTFGAITAGNTIDEGASKARKKSSSTRRFIEKLIFRMNGSPVTNMESTVLTPNMETKQFLWEPTSYQRDLLRRTWNDDFNFLYELGTSIYSYIFDHEPNAKQLFPTVAKHGEKWKESVEFRAQALKFVQVISQAIKNMYHMERLDPILHRIGARHVAFADRGFRADYWDIFRAAINSGMQPSILANATLTDEEKKDAINIWTFLADYIVHKMLFGYNAAMRERDTMSSS